MPYSLNAKKLVYNSLLNDSVPGGISQTFRLRTRSLSR